MYAKYIFSPFYLLSQWGLTFTQFNSLLFRLFTHFLELLLYCFTYPHHIEVNLYLFNLKAHEKVKYTFRLLALLLLSTLSLCFSYSLSPLYLPPIPICHFFLPYPTPLSSLYFSRRKSIMMFLKFILKC